MVSAQNTVVKIYNYTLYVPPIGEGTSKKAYKYKDTAQNTGGSGKEIIITVEIGEYPHFITETFENFKQKLIKMDKLDDDDKRNILYATEIGDYSPGGRKHRFLKFPYCHDGDGFDLIVNGKKSQIEYSNLAGLLKIVYSLHKIYLTCLDIKPENIFVKCDTDDKNYLVLGDTDGFQFNKKPWEGEIIHNCSTTPNYVSLLHLGGEFKRVSYSSDWFAILKTTLIFYLFQKCDESYDYVLINLFIKDPLTDEDLATWLDEGLDFGSAGVFFKKNKEIITMLIILLIYEYNTKEHTWKRWVENFNNIKSKLKVILTKENSSRDPILTLYGKAFINITSHPIETPLGSIETPPVSSFITTVKKKILYIKEKIISKIPNLQRRDSVVQMKQDAASPSDTPEIREKKFYDTFINPLINKLKETGKTPPTLGGGKSNIYIYRKNRKKSRKNRKKSRKYRKKSRKYRKKSRKNRKKSRKVGK